MAYDKYKTIPGIPGAENTAVTMQSIKELLEEEGATHLLKRRESKEEPAEIKRVTTGPLQQLAEASKQKKTAVQRPPVLPPLAPAEEDDMAANTAQSQKTGLLPRLFGRK